MSNKCIRVLADPVQIKECKETLSRLEGQLELTTKIFNLAGNASRLKILFLLHKEGEMCPCDFSDILGISVGGVSQHLRKLKDSGMVRDKKVGQTIFYSLIPENTQLLFPILQILVNESKTILS